MRPVGYRRNPDEETIMMKQQRLISIVAIVVALVLTTASCGSGSDSGLTTSNAPVVGDAEVLPPVDPSAEPPALAGACVVDEPECEDTLDVDPDAQDLPEPSDDPNPEAAGDAASSAVTGDGGLTISEALATDATGIIAVRGHLFDGGDGLQLCESLIGLGERYGCDGAHISVAKLDPTRVPDIVFFEGTTYTEGQITLFGELIDGTLVVDPLVAG